MAALQVECGDFLEFQYALQKMRQIDDRIIYMLNATIPTESFKSQVDPTKECKELFDQIQSGHKTRELAIQKCLDASRQRVKDLKSKKEEGDDSPQLHKALRKEQDTLRLIQTELNVEEVVKKRTVDEYSARCRSFYKPQLNK